GQVKLVAIEKEGKRPERTRYAITRAGREHLKQLLELAWRDLRSPADSLQLALAARSELTEERIAELLAERIEGLRARMRDLSRLANSAPAAEMVDRQTALTRAELSWAERLLTEMGGNRDGS
ncbi:MAG: hypothetical protein ACRDWH_04875, partial [Acidimicrobiia bacterium]